MLSCLDLKLEVDYNSIIINAGVCKKTCMDNNLDINFKFTDNHEVRSLLQ